jgi:hypothetical protein
MIGRNQTALFLVCWPRQRMEKMMGGPGCGHHGFFFYEILELTWQGRNIQMPMIEMGENNGVFIYTQKRDQRDSWLWPNWDQTPALSAQMSKQLNRQLWTRVLQVDDCRGRTLSRHKQTAAALLLTICSKGKLSPICVSLCHCAHQTKQNKNSDKNKKRKRMVSTTPFVTRP